MKTTWAAWYNPWLLIKLTPQGVVLSCLMKTHVNMACQQSITMLTSSECSAAAL